MNNYLLLVDTYEAHSTNEAVLKANNIAGMIIRMNNMEGGHQLDLTFTKQWKETAAAGLLRIPYFVYNPWVDGQANYEWFVKHIPYEAGSVMIDVEVVFPGYSPAKYAAELKKFLQLVAPRWNYMIYTGENFLRLLSQWPANADYWWGQYPFAVYPDEPEHWTWDQVRAKVDSFAGPFNAEKVPGTWKMWQFTGDRLILPGDDKPIDVNVYPGTLNQLKEWINEKPPLPDDFVEEESQPFEGVKLFKIRRYNSHCFVAVINPAGKSFQVTKYGLKKVSTVARALDAQIVINGGAYGGGHAIGLHASMGKVYQPVDDFEPWLNLTEANLPQINAHNSQAKKYNALAGKRFIVQEGRVSPNTSAAWKEVHPRTLVGVTQDGKLIECVVDGRQGPNNIGVDLYDAARIMLEFDAWKAIDLDGGGSSAMWVKDRIINSPIENGVPGLERMVGTHVVMFVDDGAPPPPPSGDYIVVKPVRPRLTPSMFEVDAKPNLSVDTTFHSETTQVVKEKIPAGTGMEFTITWVQMPDGYWVPKFYKVEYVKDLTA